MILADRAAALFGSWAGAGPVPREQLNGMSSSLGSDAAAFPSS
jgi:hypothetical protein